MLTAIIKLFQFRRSFTPNYRPARLAEGEVLLQLADGKWVIGGQDGLSIIEVPFSGQPTGVTPGVYGDGAHSVQLTIDAAGRITSAVNVPITGAGSGGGTAPTLSAVTVSPANATVGTAYTGTVSGLTAGSTRTLSGAGAAGLSISGSTITGTPTAAGPVDVIETLAGATNSPRTTSGAVTVASGGGTPGPLSFFASLFFPPLS